MGGKMRWNPPWMSRGSFAGIHSTDQYGIRWVLIPAEKPFLMAETPVTQEQYQRVMGKNPSHFRGPHHPVENVNFAAAELFSLEVGGRLPTESQWHFASKGGGTTALYGPPLEIGWFKENSNAQTHPVGLKRPNGYGLYDMRGNVWEWTIGSVGWSPRRILHGGSWKDAAKNVLEVYEHPLPLDYRDADLGFRPMKKL